MFADPLATHISDAIEPFRARLLTHPLYARLQSLEGLRIFMQHHVFAVWDFMSLLKTLQRQLTCVDVPWVPKGNGEARRLINQIVVGEESDRGPDGSAASHFELYLRAMHEAGADTKPMDEFLRHLSRGADVETALATSGAPPGVRQFVGATFREIQAGEAHVVAAVFTYGREDLIPAMFSELVNSLDAQFPGRLQTLRYYLERHIALDGDEHGELGRQMVARLCGEERQRWDDARKAAKRTLEERLALWDAIAAALV